VQDCKPEEGLRGLARAAEDDLALGALSQEWAHHFVRREVPPWHIDKHLQLINDPIKAISPSSEKQYCHKGNMYAILWQEA
jgi:hypothetical protein